MMPAEMCTLWKDSISFREEPSNSSQMDQDNSQLQFYISNTLHRRQERQEEGERNKRVCLNQESEEMAPIISKSESPQLPIIESNPICEIKLTSLPNSITPSRESTPQSSPSDFHNLNQTPSPIPQIEVVIENDSPTKKQNEQRIEIALPSQESFEKEFSTPIEDSKPAQNVNTSVNIESHRFSHIQIEKQNKNELPTPMKIDNKENQELSKDLSPKKKTSFQILLTTKFFFQYNYLDEPIDFGFYSIPRETSKLISLEEIRKSSSCPLNPSKIPPIPYAIVIQSDDEKFEKLRREARERTNASRSKRFLAKIKEFLSIIKEYFPYCGTGNIAAEFSSLASERNSIILPIGALRKASSEEFSILFKILCQDSSIACRVVRGKNPSNKNYAWNFVREDINSKWMFVNVVEGTVIAANTLQAKEYLVENGKGNGAPDEYLSDSLFFPSSSIKPLLESISPSPLSPTDSKSIIIIPDTNSNLDLNSNQKLTLNPNSNLNTNPSSNSNSEPSTPQNKILSTLGKPNLTQTTHSPISTLSSPTLLNQSLTPSISPSLKLKLIIRRPDDGSSYFSNPMSLSSRHSSSSDLDQNSFFSRGFDSVSSSNTSSPISFSDSPPSTREPLDNLSEQLSQIQTQIQSQLQNQLQNQKRGESGLIQKSLSNDKKTEKKKPKPKTDQHAPPRPLSCYHFFSKDVRQELKKQNPDMVYTEINQITVERWKNISESEKQKYNLLGQQDRELYRKRMIEYAKTDNYKRYQAYLDDFCRENGLPLRKVFDLEKNSVSRTESESLDDPCARASEEGQSQETAPKNFPVEIVKSNQRRHSATPSPKRSLSDNSKVPITAKPVQKRRKTVPSLYDIDDVVQSSLTPSQLTPIKVKEVFIPKWRVVTTESLDAQSNENDIQEDTSDEFYLKMHEKYENAERNILPLPIRRRIESSLQQSTN